MFFIHVGRLLSFCAFTIAVSVASAQSTLWSRRLEYQGNSDMPSDMAIDNSGNVYVVGTSDASGAPTTNLLVKYSSTGQRLWLKKPAYSGGSESYTMIRTDPQGNLVLVGVIYESGSGYPKLLVEKRDPDAKLLWRRSFGDSSKPGSQPRAAVVDPSGNIVVAAEVNSSNGVEDIATVKFAAVGTRLWVREYGNEWMDDRPSCVTIDPSGNVFVAGTTRGLSADTDDVTIKYDAAGRLQWTQRYDSPYGTDDYPGALACDSNGQPVVATRATLGYSTALIGYVKYSATGGLLQERYYGTPFVDFDALGGLVIDKMDNVILAGGYTGSTSLDVLLLKYGPTGDLLWTRTYDSPYGSADVAFTVALDSIGNIFIAGSSYEGDFYDTSDYLTIKYAPNGARQWVHRYDDASNLADGVVQLVVGPDDNPVVTGFSYLASIDIAPDPDFLTIKYASGGGG